MRSHIQIQDQQTNRLSSPVESLIHLDSSSSMILQNKDIDKPMVVQIKTQNESKMLDKTKGLILTDNNQSPESPTTFKYFNRKARYSNGGVIVKKSEKKDSPSMKIITIVNDSVPEKGGATPSNFTRLNSGYQITTNKRAVEAKGSVTPLLQQTTSFESIVQSVASSPKDDDKRTIHIELFGSPLLTSQILHSDRIASNEKPSLQNQTVQVKKRFESSIERNIKGEVTRMRQQMAKFPNSKPEAKLYQTGQSRTRSDQITNLKYTKRKKAQQLHIDLTQLATLEQRRGGGCAAGNLNQAQFQDHFGFFPDIHNSLRQDSNSKEDDFFFLKDQKQFKMRQALQLRAERLKQLQQSLNLRLNQQAVIKLPKDQRERVEQAMLEEWTIEGKQKDILQALSPKQAAQNLSPIKLNFARKAYVNGRNQVSFVQNIHTEPVAQISSILMSKSDLLQQVIAKVSRAKIDDVSRNQNHKVISPRNVTVEHLQQHQMVNNQNIQTSDQDTINSSRSTLHSHIKTHSQNVKKRHEFDVNPFHKESKQLLPAASLQRISPDSKVSRRILKCDSTGSLQTNQSVKKAVWPPNQPSIFQDQPEGFAEANPDLLMFQMLNSKKSVSPRLDLQSKSQRRQQKPQAVELLLVKHKHFY